MHALRGHLPQLFSGVLTPSKQGVFIGWSCDAWTAGTPSGDAAKGAALVVHPLLRCAPPGAAGMGRRSRCFTIRRQREQGEHMTGLLWKATRRERMRVARRRERRIKRCVGTSPMRSEEGEEDPQVRCSRFRRTRWLHGARFGSSGAPPSRTLPNQFIAAGNTRSSSSPNALGSSVYVAPHTQQKLLVVVGARRHGESWIQGLAVRISSSRGVDIRGRRSRGRTTFRCCAGTSGEPWGEDRDRPAAKAALFEIESVMGALDCQEPVVTRGPGWPGRMAAAVAAWFL